MGSPTAKHYYELLFMKFFILLFTLLLVSCSPGKHTNKPEKHIIKVQSTTLHKSLFFTGTMQPLRETTLTAPLDSVIDSMPHSYGQKVQKDDKVFILNSAELQKQYNETLTEYLKAKDAYVIAKSKFTGTQDLWNAGLIAKNSYIGEKSGLNTAKIALMQATERLSDLLEKTGENSANFASLSFSDFEKVKKILSIKHNLVNIKATSPGVLLYPPKNSEEKSNQLTVGSSVKAGHVLGLIGDLSGVRIEIEIPEVDIDKVKPGMRAMVRSVSFPNEELTGEIVAINAQATSGNGAALPSFPAVIEVRNLSSQQQEWVKVGMSANIELFIDNHNKLMIPIQAIRHHNGKSIVSLVKNGKIQQQIITTGATNGDQVVVTSGLHENDEIVHG
ncbi:Membrane-fusion protein (plasmid) [Legionella adelaidensis]|uniref:Membrane-fusion protein n=2 Tax=Legionella adelaidensis TaxID=45056 RepID=A0A0W0R0X0_9GAMM|nr:membrane-fusion protein AcrA [Legionella adelaidensis]VEH86106.1 Membrane-fusion protein [Legionella adelaidensis]